MRYRWLSIIFLICFFAFVLLFPAVLQTEKLFNIYKKLQTTTILFIPGLGLHAKDYHTLISKLEKDHYQVITYNATDTKESDYQKLVKEWAKGVSMEIGDRRVIIIGHSVGGSVAEYFCSYDKRCIAGVNLDGAAAFENKIVVPFLYIQADAGNYCDQQCFQGRALMEKVTKESGTQFVHIQGIKHYNFTDLRTQAIKDKDYLGQVDGRDIIYADIHAFLQKHHN